jgi:hypothetical protein
MIPVVGRIFPRRNLHPPVLPGQFPEGICDFVEQHAVQESKVHGVTPVKDHLFVNNVRFLSMLSVVLVHCTVQVHRLQHADRTPLLCQLLILLLKFGSINFFLVSGFLAGERMGQRKPMEYLKQRLRNVCAPWMVWGMLWCAILVLHDFRHGKLAPLSLHGLIPVAAHYIESGIFLTSFWFVPNLMVGLCLLMLLRRWCNDLAIGAILAAFSIFYAVNVYGQWVPSVHTEAMVGFVFYIWLGTWGARNFASIQRWLSGIPLRWIVLFALATLLAAVKEAQILAAMHAPDETNTLRITNQFYSLAVTLLLLKMRGPISPRFIQVRETTFGIYLTHVLSLAIVSSALGFLIPRYGTYGFWSYQIGSLLGALVLFTGTYALSVLMVKGLLVIPTLRWTVYPVSAAKKTPAATQVLAPTSA